MPLTPVTTEDIAVVSKQLGRQARDIVAIAARCTCGKPTVVQTAPRLGDGTPFPTTYYLTHPAATAAVCLGTASEVQIEEVDAKASQSVAAKSNPLANVYLTSDEQLYALNTGIGNVQYHEITVPRSNAVHVLFHNDSAEPRRLTVHLGTFKAKDGSEGSEEAECTTALEKGGTAFLSFKINKSQLASSTPYRLTVPGVEDQEIKLLVP